MGYTILYADDEVGLCEIIQMFFKKNGFEVFCAHSGEGALDIIGREKIDLLILDRKMPGMGSQGVLKELKKRRSRIPVIILSGSHDGTERADEASKAGCIDMMCKPVDLNILLELVKRRLKG